MLNKIIGLQSWLFKTQDSDLAGLSVDCKPNACQLDPQSGNMPGLRARSPVGGAREATTH